MVGKCMFLIFPIETVPFLMDLRILWGVSPSLLESSTCQMLCIPCPQDLVIGRNKLYLYIHTVYSIIYKLMKTVKFESLKHASNYIFMDSGINHHNEITDSHSHRCHSNEALSVSGYINKSTKTPWVCGHLHPCWVPQHKEDANAVNRLAASGNPDTLNQQLVTTFFQS